MDGLGLLSTEYASSSDEDEGGDAEEQGQSVTLKDMHGNDSRGSSQQQTMSLDSAIGRILQIRE